MLNMDISIHNMLFRPELYTTNTDILHKLQPYMLTTNVLQHTNNTSNITKICNDNNIDNKTPTTLDESRPSELIVPRHNDSLFWCIYILLNDGCLRIVPSEFSFGFPYNLRVSASSLLNNSSFNSRTSSVEIRVNKASVTFSVVDFQASIILLWLSAVLTLYTGYDYMRKGIDHAISEDNKD